MPTQAHGETKMRPWMHHTKHIKHNRYLPHGRARPNAGAIVAHTWFSGAPDVRRLPQPTGSAAESSRVRQALEVIRTGTRHPRRHAFTALYTQ